MTTTIHHLFRPLHTAWLLTLFLSVLTLSACSGDEAPQPQPAPPSEEAKTLFVYLPWSSNLTGYFYNNIADLETAVSRRGLDNERIIVFMSTTADEAVMFEIVCENGRCSRNTLKRYSNPAFTTAGGITRILTDMKTFAPAGSYAMTIGCHGMGWLPVNGVSGRRRAASAVMPHWNYTDGPQTRYFGGTTSQYQTDVSTLADGIAGAGLRMEFILFDDCYMSSVEVAYDLRRVTGYLVACPTEIMAYGMPYATIGAHLLGEPDYAAVCEAFLSFYSSYSSPYGTIGVTRCAELDSLARVMRKINAACRFDERSRYGLQRMDGYSPVLFYDLGDYVAALCADPALLEEFSMQLERAVPHKAHTPMYYSSSIAGAVPIRAYSGITTSAPSVNPWAADWPHTAWYEATHD